VTSASLVSRTLASLTGVC